ncbi:hypothetical protein WJX73_009821 [Symbiochloris irregularis]|uniref:Uncharacterized protein n=1 Tax=Symbiochloris irregularis TaxID=706552 RepID=A0AAW1P453_9CHLO
MHVSQTANAGSDSDDDVDPADALRSKLHPEYFGRGSYKGAISSHADADVSDAGLAPTTPPLEEVNPASATPHERSNAKRVEPASAASLPAPAAARCTVRLSFTPLETPHLPARQPNQDHLKAGKDERDQLQLHANAPLSTQHPLMLRDKGDRMLAQRNPAGAVNAFTSALDLDPRCASALAGRATCHLQLGCFEQCLANCTAALGILLAKQHVDLTEEEQRVLAAVRATQTAAQERMPSMSTPQAQTVAQPVSAADAGQHTSAEQESESAVARRRADALVADQAYEEAVRVYTGLIQQSAGASALPVKEVIALRSNRAAALVAMQRYDSALEDCSSALALLTGGQSASEDLKIWISAAKTALQRPSAAQGACAMRLLARRALCDANTGRLQLAQDDYQAALALCGHLAQVAGG